MSHPTTKSEILDEIRRTAAANGGVPLGSSRFEHVTGIRPYDWEKYWARFGDAQSEAGFVPNTLRGAYEDGFLISRLVDLVRELRRFPTQRELRIKRMADATFPNEQAFNRWGSKNDRVGRVLAFCDDKPEYEDVIEICEAVYAPNLSAPDVEDVRPVSVVYGFVYLAQGHPGEYKIGRTNLVDRRLAEIGATASVQLKVIHEIKTDDPSGVEAYWHKRFEQKWMRGEWFRLTAADVAAFKRWRRLA